MAYRVGDTIGVTGPPRSGDAGTQARAATGTATAARAAAGSPDGPWTACRPARRYLRRRGLEHGARHRRPVAHRGRRGRPHRGGCRTRGRGRRRRRDWWWRRDSRRHCRRHHGVGGACGLPRRARRADRVGPMPGVQQPPVSTATHEEAEAAYLQNPKSVMRSCIRLPRPDVRDELGPRRGPSGIPGRRPHPGRPRPSRRRQPLGLAREDTVHSPAGSADDDATTGGARAGHPRGRRRPRPPRPRPRRTSRPHRRPRLRPPQPRRPPLPRPRPRLRRLDRRDGRSPTTSS